MKPYTVRLVSVASGLLIGACALLAALSLWVGDSLTRPAMRAVGPAPVGLPAESIRIARTPGVLTAGWFMPGERGAGAVLLLHPVRSDRRAMLGRARFLHRQGYSVLLIDMQAHGETPGARISMGWHEARDVETALGWLAVRLPGERQGVIGVSLGGAAAVFARPPVRPAAMVLEAVYPELHAAVRNRLKLRLVLHLGGEQLASLLAPLLLAQAPLWFGVPSEALTPAQALAGKGPMLLIAGEHDRHTTLADTTRLLRSGGSDAHLWVVVGAAHQDLHAFDPAGYESRVGSFLARHLDVRRGAVRGGERG